MYDVCPPVRKIIHSLKLVDYLHVQADNPWYNYYLVRKCLMLLQGNRKIVSEAYAIAKLGIVINSSINFLLYCVSGRRFRKELLTVVCGKIAVLRTDSTSYSTSSTSHSMISRTKSAISKTESVSKSENNCI